MFSPLSLSKMSVPCSLMGLKFSAAIVLSRRPRRPKEETTSRLERTSVCFFFFVFRKSPSILVFWILDFGFWIWDLGFRTLIFLDFGFWISTNLPPHFSSSPYGYGDLSTWWCLHLPEEFKKSSRTARGLVFLNY